MLIRADRIREPDRQLVRNACRQITEASLSLYLQALVTFELLHQVISHVSMYFAQRQPQELGAFTWIIDGKEPTKKTNWEQWWSWYAQGALANMSIHRPAPRFEKGDYSFYNRFKKKSDDTSEGIDLSCLLYTSDAADE